MKLAVSFAASPRLWARRVFIVFCVLFGAPAWAIGTAVGTQIEAAATANFNIAGTQLTAQSNTVSFVVAERVNVTATLQSAQILVSANDVNQALLYTVTNIGNGTESFALTVDSNLGGDDFDPIPAVPAIYFDSDSSGDFNAGDQAYVAGGNDPSLAPDASIDVFVVNDIPAAVVNGEIGLSELTATSLTGSGSAGTVFAGQGDGGTDAVIGLTGGTASASGEYLVSEVLINMLKAQQVADPFGGSEPVPGATLTYTITVEVQSSGVATASVVRDAIPIYTTYVPGSMTLNGATLTDVADTDAGEFDSTVPQVLVTLGDLVQADGIQTVEFQVIID